MTAHRTSGAIALSADVPSRLVGSLVTYIDDDGLAWIQLSYFASDDVFALDVHDGGASLTIRRDLVEAVLGSFSILLAAADWMRGSEGSVPPRATQEPFAVEVPAPSRGKVSLVRCSWRTMLDGMKSSLVDEQVNLCFRADRAHDLALRLASELGRVAAQP